jgi:hypothetical protein
VPLPAAPGRPTWPRFGAWLCAAFKQLYPLPNRLKLGSVPYCISWNLGQPSSEVSESLTRPRLELPPSAHSAARRSPQKPFWSCDGGCLVHIVASASCSWFQLHTSPSLGDAAPHFRESGERGGVFRGLRDTQDSCFWMVKHHRVKTRDCAGRSCDAVELRRQLERTGCSCQNKRDSSTRSRRPRSAHFRPSYVQSTDDFSFYFDKKDTWDTADTRFPLPRLDKRGV